MPLFDIFPTLPWTTAEIFFNTLACLGVIMLVYSIFLEAETKQDAVMFLGATLLGIYASWIGNTIFLVAMAGVSVASLVEFIEIFTARRNANENVYHK